MVERGMEASKQEGWRQANINLGCLGFIPTARHSAELVPRCQCLVVFAKCFGNLGRAVGRKGGREAGRVEGGDEFRVGMVEGIHR